jgi:hypothetical protein
MESKPVTDRRRFLSDVGYATLLLGGASLSPTPLFETRASAQAETRETVRPVKDDGPRLRGFAVVRRAPGQSRKDVRRKALVPLSGYSRACLDELTKPVNARQSMFIQCYVNDASYGAEGGTGCPVISERDFVSEWQFVVEDGAGVPRPEPEGERRRPPRPPTLVDWAESGTDIRLIMRQVIAEGNRLLAIPGREKGMHFVKMASNVPAADYGKVWQDLHAKAIDQAPEVFAGNLTGHELLERMPGTAARQLNRCGAEMPVPDLVSQFWLKTPAGSQQFLNYVKALYQADQQNALDKPASFALLLEEWEGMMSNAGNPG